MSTCTRNGATGNAYLIIDGMWGSCGKGLLAGKLALDRSPDVVVCNFGPNAGHTFRRGDLVLMTQQLPTGLLSPGLEHLLLGPGAVIDPSILAAELRLRPEVEGKLHIHENAAVVTWADKLAEEALLAIGSTRKGTAAAQARKMMRVDTVGIPRRAGECRDLERFVIRGRSYDRIIGGARSLQVESAQGVELSLSRGYFYPYCTGRDVTPEQVLNDCGVPYRFLGETFLVMRTFPIRVGDEFREGEKVGTSGPVYPGMEELTWEQLSKESGIEGLQERTTVTKKVRRVFRPSEEQVMHAMWVVGPSTLFLNFMNYLDPNGWRVGLVSPKAKDFVRLMDDCAEAVWGEGPHFLLGWGPDYGEVENYGMLMHEQAPHE